MDKLKTTQVGGFPFILDDIRWLLGRLSGRQGIYQAFNNIFGNFADSMIIQGVEASGTTPNIVITEGWILLDNEMIKVDGQTGINTSTDTKFVKVTTFDTRGNKDFQNGSNADTYEKNRGVVSGLVGSLPFNTPADRLENLIRVESIATKGSGLVKLKKDIIDIGDWDMDSTISVTIPHGLSANFKKIRSIAVMIQNDTQTTMSRLDGNTAAGDGTVTAPQGAIRTIDSTNIELLRLTGGIFDGVTFSTTSFNRGFIFIERLF